MFANLWWFRYTKFSQSSTFTCFASGLSSLSSTLVFSLSLNKSFLASNLPNLVLANINSPKQIVIAGESEAVEIVIDNLKDKGHKKCIKLNVSVASHCKLMDKASIDFKHLLDTIEFLKPQNRIIHNISALEANNIDELKENLILHLTKPVLWSKTMNYINSFDGIVIECGPGKVLTGLAKSNGIKNIFTSSSENFYDDLKSAL